MKDAGGHEITGTLDLGTETDIGYWNYTLDDASKTVTLNYYDSSLEEGYDWHNPRECVDIYASYDIGGAVYKTQLASQEQARSSSKSTYFFRKNASYIDEISFSDKIDTSNLTGTVQMFAGLTGLKNINWGSFDTSNVTNMAGMFEGSIIHNNIVLDLSNFVTDKVTDMSYMFSGCAKNGTGLKAVNLSSFNTSNVTNMRNMFSSSYYLEGLDVSTFNTSNVTDMGNMFAYLHCIDNLGLHNFNTSNVTDMGYMFAGCKSLQELNLLSFDTSNVTNMGSMFAGCQSLKKLNISSFNTSKVTTMKEMFGNYSSGVLVSELDLSNFDTSNVTDMSYMFSKSHIRKINLSSFDTQKVKDFSYMFQSCTHLTKLNLTPFTNSCTYGSKQASVYGMFKNTALLEEVLVSDNWAKECVQDNTFEGSGCTGFTWE